MKNRVMFGMRRVVLAGMIGVCAASGAFAETAPAATNNGGKVPEWPFLTGAPTMPQLQQMLQIVLQLIQQAMQLRQQQQQQQQQGAPGTPAYYNTPNYVTDNGGNPVNCTTTYAVVCPLYAVGYTDGLAASVLKTQYMYDVNYLSGYQAGRTTRGN